MGKRLSFSIAVNLLTENFRKGANTIQNSLRSIQMQIVTFAAALGVGGMGLIGLISRLKDVARETNRVLTALKNVSGGTQGFADNLKFLNQLADKYGIEVNGLIESFTKFTASATQAGMSMDNQNKIFESLSRASTAFGLTADENKGVMLALSQMMGKGKISSEELRKQMGEKLPVAMQAMAKAAGVSMAGLEKLLKQGKLMSADILPKFADALNEMIPEISTDNLESSLGRLENAFGKFTDATGFQEKYKVLIDGLTSAITSAGENIKNIVIGIAAVILFVSSNSGIKVLKNWDRVANEMVSKTKALETNLTTTTAARVAAQKRLEESRLAHQTAIGRNRIRAAERLNRQEILFARSVVNEDKARLALEQANATQRVGVFTRGLNIMRLGMAKVALSLKAMWSAYAPALILTVITTLAYKIYELATATSSADKAMANFNAEAITESKNLNNIFDAYKKANVGTKEKDRLLNLIKSKYGQYIKDLIDEKGRITDIDKAQRLANESLRQSIALRVKNTALGEVQEEEVKKQASLLGNIRNRIAKDKGDDVANLAIEYIGAKMNNDNIPIDEAQRDITDYIKLITGEKQYTSKYTGLSNNDLLDVLTSVKKVRDDTRDIENQFKGIIGDYKEPITPDVPTVTGGDDTEDKGAKAAAEKRLEALRKLDEEDQKRQTEKLAFDNEIRQKEIDGMVEGYDKRIAQLKLNSDKEDQAIKEFAQKAAKDQLDYAKTKYVSTAGTSTGFEDYYAKADLSKIMPEGLRPEDVTKQVNALYASAKEANKKGLDQINIEISKSIIEERLQFASEMEQKIYDTENYFNERRRLVKKGSDDYFELLSLESKALESIKSQHNTKLIQMENEYKEKAVELTSELFFFQSDKDAALLRQRIESNQKYIDSLKKELKVLTGLEFDVLDEVTLNNLTKAYPELIFAIKKAKQEQQGFNNEFARTPAQKLMEISGLFNQISGTLGDISGLDFSMLSNAVSGIASFANGDFMGAASSSLGIVSTVVSGIIGKMERQAQIQREILKLQQDYDIALRQQNYDLISSIDYARAFKDNMEALHWLIEKGFVSDTDFSVWEELENHALTASKNVDAARKSYDAIFGDGEKVLSSMYDDRAGLGRLDKGFLKDIEDWKNGIITTEEALKRLGARGYKGLTDIAEQIDRAKEETDKWTDSMVELSKQMDQFVTGTDFDGFLDSTMTALTNLKSGVSDLGDFTEETLKNAVLSSFKYKVLADALKPMYDRLANMFLEDTLDPTDVSQWGVDLENLTKDYSDKLEAVYKSLGLDFENSKTQKASTGVSQTITEDTGSRLDGRLSAVQMSGLRMEGFLSSLSLSSSNLLNTNISIDNELKKHTSIFNEMRTIQLNTFHEIEGTGKSMKRIEEQITKVEKNTSKL